MEKDTREAIRSVVGSLPKIDQLKPEQEQALLSLVGGHDVVTLLPGHRNVVSGRSRRMKIGRASCRERV